MNDTIREFERRVIALEHRNDELLRENSRLRVLVAQHEATILSLRAQLEAGKRE